MRFTENLRELTSLYYSCWSEGTHSKHTVRYLRTDLIEDSGSLTDSRLMFFDLHLAELIDFKGTLIT